MYGVVSGGGAKWLCGLLDFGSGDGVLVGVCSSGRLVALVSPSYHAQFITGEIGM